jgi:hypothetical protein
VESLSSSPPRIPGTSPTRQTAHQRSSTTSSQPIDHQQVFAIQDATETPRCILNTRSGHVSSGTLEGLVQHLIDGFGELTSRYRLLQVLRHD